MQITLTAKQTKFWDMLFDDNCKIIDNKYKEFYSIGGFGSGKSRIINMSVNMICTQYPNSHGCYIRGTFQELKDSVIPQFLEYEPANVYKYRYLKADRTAEYRNGTRLDFRAFDKDVKILSNEYDFIAYSQIEEIKKDLFLQSLGRNRRMLGGLPKNIILGEGNPSSGWLKRRIKKTKNDDVFLIESKTCDNTENLPKDYESNLRKNYPKFWIARYLDGEWSSFDDMVFPEFREKKHIIDPIAYKYLEAYKQRMGLDYGWINPTAILWGCIDYEGRVIIFDEWGGSGKMTSEIAHEAHRYGKKPVVADYSIKKPDRDGRSVWDDLVTAGMNLEPSNKDDLENIILINSLFKQDRLLITRNCVKLLEEIPNYMMRKLKLGEDKNRPETAIDKDNHYIKALQYMLASLEELRTVDPRKKQYERSLEYANIHKPPARNMS